MYSIRRMIKMWQKTKTWGAPRSVPVVCGGGVGFQVVQEADVPDMNVGNI